MFVLDITPTFILMLSISEHVLLLKRVLEYTLQLVYNSLQFLCKNVNEVLVKT